MDLQEISQMNGVFFILTPVIYCLFPLFFAIFRRKPITKRKYYALCFSINFIPKFVFILLSSTNMYAFFIWTWLFSICGEGILNKKDMISLPVPKSERKKTKLEQSPNTIAKTESLYAGDEAQVLEVISKESIPTEHTSDSTRQKKKRYCRFCGGLIDHETKVCLGCGKQYFRLPKPGKRASWILTSVFALTTIVLAVMLIGTIAFFSDKIETWENEVSIIEKGIDKQEATIKSLEEKNSNLQEALEAQKKAANMANENFREEVIRSEKLANSISDLNRTLKTIAFVPDDGKKKYHNINCSIWQSWDGQYWCFNVEYAKYKGYKPCSKCH